MKASDAFQQIALRLSPQYGAGEAKAMARIVLEDAFGIKLGALNTASLSENKLEYLDNIMHRLDQGEPVQYVLGTAQFFGLNFIVTPDVLIPRQETEELVALVLRFLKDKKWPQPTILDIGLGSGCIGIALKAKYPGIQLFGIEVDPDALAIAQTNAANLLPPNSWQFWQMDILNPVPKPELPKLSAIVSNPPYIPYSELNHVGMQVQQFEPHLALFVPNEDPLLFYKKIAQFAHLHLDSGAALFFECNTFHANAVARLMLHQGYSQVQLLQDLNGNDRICWGLKP
ncbi:MAG: peptide chain release factor N(5)-glutamine methyltransferase [Bacteroidetes bacterium]|nr:peptide chain release factor N(5)-glutamine methyltransferase [Bacteroidota bacterium]